MRLSLSPPPTTHARALCYTCSRGGGHETHLFLQLLRDNPMGHMETQQKLADLQYIRRTKPHFTGPNPAQPSPSHQDTMRVGAALSPPFSSAVKHTRRRRDTLQWWGRGGSGRRCCVAEEEVPGGAYNIVRALADNAFNAGRQHALKLRMRPQVLLVGQAQCRLVGGGGTRAGEWVGWESGRGGWVGGGTVNVCVCVEHRGGAVNTRSCRSSRPRCCVQGARVVYTAHTWSYGKETRGKGCCQRTTGPGPQADRATQCNE